MNSSNYQVFHCPLSTKPVIIFAYICRLLYQDYSVQGLFYKRTGALIRSANLSNTFNQIDSTMHQIKKGN